MSIKEQIAINVLNYNEFIVSATTHIQGHVFRPSIDGIPTMHPMSFAEIQHLNGKSDCFRTGLLRFDKDQEEEVYITLNINNWKDIITNDFIEDAIVNSNKEKLQKLIDVTNQNIFDRVKTILIRLQNSGDVDISNRVINTLLARDEELKSGKYKSEIVIKAKEKLDDLPNEEVNELKAQLAEMQKMMAILMSDKTETDATKDELKEVEVVAKKRGRPAQKTK